MELHTKRKHYNYKNYIVKSYRFNLEAYLSHQIGLFYISKNQGYNVICIPKGSLQGTWQQLKKIKVTFRQLENDLAKQTIKKSFEEKN